MLPTTLRSLVLGSSSTSLTPVGYNCPLPVGIIPYGVTKVLIGDAFAQHLVPGAIPLSVTQLSLGELCSSRYPLKAGAIPRSVTNLTIKFAVATAGLIPSSVVYLDCKYRSVPRLASGVIPTSVTHLQMFKAQHVGVIPMSVTYLNLANVDCNDQLEIGAIPSSVTNLSMASDCKQSIGPGILPPQLTHLELTGLSQHSTITLPSSVRLVRLPREQRSSITWIGAAPYISCWRVNIPGSERSSTSAWFPEIHWQNPQCKYSTATNVLELC